MVLSMKDKLKKKSHLLRKSDYNVYLMLDDGTKTMQKWEMTVQEKYGK